jgi:hypothetical protein
MTSVQPEQADCNTINATAASGGMNSPRQEEEFRKTRCAVATSKLTEFRKQCWRLAGLVRQGIVNRLDAIDLLYEVAIGHALVRSLGEDRITAILSEAFAGATFDPMCAEVA